MTSDQRDSLRRAVMNAIAIGATVVELEPRRVLELVDDAAERARARRTETVIAIVVGVVVGLAGLWRVLR